MPNGYTDMIYDGNDNPRDFLMRWIQAFLPEYWDYSGPLRPSVKVDSYYSEELAKAEARLQDFLSLSKDSLEEKYEQHKNEFKEYNIRRAQKLTEDRKRLETVRDSLANMTIPDDECWKIFIEKGIAAINETIEWDCSDSRLEDARNSVNDPFMSYQKWYETTKAELERDASHYRKEHVRERERVEKRNAHVAEFLKILDDNFPETS